MNEDAVVRMSFLDVLNILDTIHHDDIRKFARSCIDIIPDYFWDVGASGTGKYHPRYAQGTGGLARHTCGVCKVLNYMLELDSVKINFSDRERDLLRVAAIMHDSFKYGEQADYNKDPHTKFKHPLIAAQKVRGVEGLSMPEKEFIATAIESHMGQWNTSKNGDKLPLPRKNYQVILHVADYLASRKDIEIMFQNDTADDLKSGYMEEKWREQNNELD